VWVAAGGGPPSQIRAAALEALGGAVQQVHAEPDAVPVTQLRAVLARVREADERAESLTVPLTPPNLNP
jgi:hypothetical protein